VREERITNPQTVERAEIEAKIAAGNRVILQFGELCYSSELLKKINNLCCELGKNLEVRFWGHYGHGFDASHLRFLPDVVALSVDGLMEASNLSALFELKNLRRLSLGIFKLGFPDWLNKIKLENLEEFSLDEAEKLNLDLSPLKNCSKLERLSLTSHFKNIDCLAQLPALRELWLRRISKKQNLGFVSKILNLKRCSLILGGRTDISEINHQGLEELEIILVQGFSSFENLKEFPSLRALKIQDQIRLGKIRFADANKNLQSLSIWNCKTLSRLEGIHHLANLQSVFLGKTDISFDSLIKQKRPSSLKIFNFSTNKVKENAEIRRTLDMLGYQEK
jgi:hypothetical protein